MLRGFLLFSVAFLAALYVYHDLRKDTPGEEAAERDIHEEPEIALFGPQSPNHRDDEQNQGQACGHKRIIASKYDHASINSRRGRMGPVGFTPIGFSV